MKALELLHRQMGDVVNVRQFRPDPVPPELEQLLLESFRLGPSSANIQPWEIVTVESPSLRDAVVAVTLDPFLSRDSAGAQAWLRDVPLLLAVCLDRPRAEGRLGPIGWEQSGQDAFAALQNMRLAAVHVGLATTIVREFDRAGLQQALRLPFTVEPLVLVAIGYAAVPPEHPPRLELAHIVHRDGWRA